ncbi:MAG: hypothetical protein C0478_06530, partial [Planctomyces sp.]|nr:hypothetical protein [Planctomyces sp.]
MIAFPVTGVTIDTVRQIPEPILPAGSSSAMAYLRRHSPVRSESNGGCLAYSSRCIVRDDLMQTRHWFKNLRGFKYLLGGLMLASGSVTLGQDASMNPDLGSYYPPSGYQPVQGGYAPEGYGPGMAPPSYQPGVNPWPAVSPFEGPPFQQIQQENGFWFDNSKWGPPKMSFAVEGLYGLYKKPNKRLVGSEGILPLYRPTTTTGTGTGTGTTATQSDITPFSYTDFPQESTAGGIRLTLEGEGVDESGWTVSGFWLDEGTETDRRVATPAPTSVTSVPVYVIPIVDRVQIVGSLPLFDGDGNLDNASNGGVQKFDLLFEQTHSSQFYGANIGGMLNPWKEGDGYRIRPTYGIRYFGLRETYAFHGIDSGLNYTVGTNDLAVDTTTGRPLPTAIITQEDPLLDSTLRSVVRSQFAGPEVGFRVDLGKERFKIISHTKFGLLANNSKRSLQYKNIYNQTGAGNAPPTTGVDQV